MNLRKSLNNLSPRLWFFYGCFAIGALLTTFTLIQTFRPNISYAVLVAPNGAESSIRLPYANDSVGINGIYTTKLQIVNSILFSGKLQLIQKKCVEELVVNGTKIDNRYFASNNCDDRNGQYLLLKSFLKQGKNTVEIKISTDQQHLEVSLYDMTFYDKYWIGMLILLLFPIIYIRSAGEAFSSQVYCLVKGYRRYLTIFSLLILLSIILTIVSYFVASDTFKGFIIIVFLSSFFLPSALYINDKMIYGRQSVILFTLAVAMLCCFLFRLSYNKYAYDIDGHLEYVRYLINHGESPVAKGGWLFYHPSLYYRIAAIIYPVVNLANPYDDSEFGKYLQCLSAAFFVIYYFFGLKTIDLFIKLLDNNISEKLKKTIFFISAITFLLWPSNNFIGVRAGNDILFDVLFIISFFFISKWWVKKQNTSLYIAIIVCSLCVWAKTNGFIAYILLGFLLAVNLYHNKKTNNYFKRSYLQYGIFIAAFSLTCYFSFHHKIEQWLIDPGTRLIVGNVNGLGANAVVQNKIENYLLFNPIHFIERPFTDSFDDAKGRNYFWFFLLKSSMFGEFGFADRTLQLIAQIMSFFLLTLIPLAVVWGLKACFKYYKYSSLAILVNFAILLILMIIFRIYYPYASSADFRYIFPFVLPLALVLGAGVAIIKNKATRSIYQCLIIGFLLAGLCFQLVFLF